MIDSQLNPVESKNDDLPKIVEPKPDPFDLTRLRLDQSFIETAGVKKLLTTVRVGKPQSQDFVRTQPKPEYRDGFATLEWREDREFYIVTPDVARELPGECVFVTLHAYITRQGAIGLWPVRLPGPDGRIIEAYRAQAEAAERAATRWTRIKWNVSTRAYDLYEASDTIPDPEWPDVTFQELLRIGFRDRLIDGLNHPVLDKLRGLR